MDDTTAEVVRRLQGMGLIVAEMSDGPPGVLLKVLIPALESVASGNNRPHN